MQKIEFDQSNAATIRALKKCLGQYVILNLATSRSQGILSAVTEKAVTMTCEESGDEFMINISKLRSMESPRKNWQSVGKSGVVVKTERLQVRCTLAERSALEARAKNAGKTLSEYVIAKCLSGRT